MAPGACGMRPLHACCAAECVRRRRQDGQALQEELHAVGAVREGEGLPPGHRHGRQVVHRPVRPRVEGCLLQRCLRVLTGVLTGHTIMRAAAVVSGASASAASAATARTRSRAGGSRKTVRAFSEHSCRSPAQNLLSIARSKPRSTAEYPQYLITTEHPAVLLSTLTTVTTLTRPALRCRRRVPRVSQCVGCRRPAVHAVREGGRLRHQPSRRRRRRRRRHVHGPCEAVKG